MKLKRLSKIKVPEHWCLPNFYKLMERTVYYAQYKRYKVPIVVDKNNMLVDGYTSYLIAKGLNKKIVRVEVRK